MEYTEFIHTSLEKVSKIALDYFGKVNGITKGEDNNQVLTQADIEIGKALIESVQISYPHYNIIDEEAGAIDNNSDYTWVIDPIDGTSNFASGVPTYGIYLGLLYHEKPIAGGIAIPAFSEIFLAERGKGTICNGNRVFVTTETQLKNILLAYGIDAHPEEPNFVEREGNLLMNLVLAVRNLRTSNSAYDGSLVAKGSYGAWLCRSSKIWDNVALQIVIEEAGGKYTDFYGNPMDYSNPLKRTKESFTYCAASPILHDQLQKIIHG